MSELYRGPIIDAHHHLWNLTLERHPWLSPEAGARGGLGDLGPLQRSYLPADYAREAARHAIVATVHVEAGWLTSDPSGETRWLDTLDKTGGIATRYVAHVPLVSEAAPVMLAEQAAHPRVVGVRDILSWHEDPARRFAARGDLMGDPVWRGNLKRLAGLGLSFDLMVFAHQLPEAARLVADFPDQVFVLNHCGSPIDRTADGLRGWREGLAALAAHPNARIKLSGLVAYDHEWTVSSLAAVIGHCIACFGPDRAMFGSDFPVAGLHAGFDALWDAFKLITADLPASDQQALFFTTAARTYGLHDEISAPLGFAPRQEQEPQDQGAEQDAPPAR